MHKKFVIAGFVIAIAAIVTIVSLRYLKEKKSQSSNIKVSQSASSVQEEDTVREMIAYGGDEPLTSLIPLEDDETLVAVLNESLEEESESVMHDELLDQIVAVKNSSDSAIMLIVGFYNSETDSYGRDAFIQTDIKQVSSFSYYTADLTGDHRVSIVYQGINQQGLSELSVWHVKRLADKIIPEQLGHFTSNDVIYIQESDRYYDYDMAEADGAAYPVYVYSMEGEGRMKDQVLNVYTWDKTSQSFQVTSQSRVTAASLANKELSFVQGGSLDSYAEFLNGLWKLTDTSSKEDILIYFDYDEKSIIFAMGDTQSYYTWDQNYLRYSGIYITSSNAEITNFRRRIDISLRGVDSIQVRLMDDVRMIISEGSEWDGLYKKLNVKDYYTEKASVSPTDYVQDFIDQLEKGPSWRASDGSVITFTDGQYTSLASDGLISNGFYTKVQFMDMPFIQFRSPANATWLNGTYLLSYAEVTGLNEKNSLILQPYTLSPQSANVSDERPLILNRIIDENLN